jgi:hypothetical protein
VIPVFQVPVPNEKKGGTFWSAALFICQAGYLIAAMPRCAAAAAGGTAGAEFNARINFKPVS